MHIICIYISRELEGAVVYSGIIADLQLFQKNKTTADQVIEGSNVLDI